LQAAAVDHMASTVIELSAEQVGALHVRHRRRSGKVLAEDTGYAISLSFMCTAVPLSAVAAKQSEGFRAAMATATPITPAATSHKPDPTKNLTFNMHQTDQSQRARQVVNCFVCSFFKTTKIAPAGHGTAIRKNCWKNLLRSRANQRGKCDDADDNDDPSLLGGNVFHVVHFFYFSPFLFFMRRRRRL
jgi:hypothetical protein